MNPYSHVDMRVRDMGSALLFYERLLPALGFDSDRLDDEEWRVFVARGRLPDAAFFSITEDREHRPNANRVAFWVPTRADVDRMGELLAELGADVESGPRACTEYGGDYYAVFFSDPSGNLLEIVHRTR